MKYLIAVICAVLCFSVNAHAQNYQIKTNLVKEHGLQLDKALFPIRYKFRKVTQIDWKFSTYDARKAFLNKYYFELERDQKLEKIRLAKEKEEARKVRQIKRALKDKEKNKIRKQRAEERLDAAKNRQEKQKLSDKVRQRKDLIKDLRRKSK